ncbi:MAG: hypothetical protein HZB13_20445 [Acidobacteria bacterium]|nr:hypothetical protein [Acidobacteriota bacterium]
MPVTLPPSTTEVKFQHGRIIALEAGDPGAFVVIRDREGRPLRRVQAGAGVGGLRRAEVRDFALQADQSLTVALGVAFSMGKTSRVLAVYPQRGEARFSGLDDVMCTKLAVDELTGAWCLGPGQDDSLLHRVSGPAEGPWSLLARRRLPLVPNPAGEHREAFETGPAGVPALMNAAPGRLLAWLPNAVALLEIDVVTGRGTTWRIPFGVGGRSMLTFACSGRGVYGLLPARGPGEPERLSTAYELCALDRASGEFRPVGGRARFARGASLAGMDGEQAVVWDRARRRLEWIRTPGGTEYHEKE